MGYSHTIFHKMCENWKGLLDFPDNYGYSVSRYYLAVFCPECCVWFPKDVVRVWCPCCKARVRHRSPKFAMTKDVIEHCETEMKLFRGHYPDWTLINQSKVMKPIIDLKIAKGLL